MFNPLSPSLRLAVSKWVLSACHVVRFLGILSALFLKVALNIQYFTNEREDRREIIAAVVMTSANTLCTTNENISVVNKCCESEISQYYIKSLKGAQMQYMIAGNKMLFLEASNKKKFRITNIMVISNS